MIMKYPKLLDVVSKIIPKGNAYINSETGQLFETKDIKEALSSSKTGNTSEIPKSLTGSTNPTFQKFIKRLRYYFYDDKDAITLLPLR